MRTTGTTHVRSASSIMGNGVTNTAGEDLGTIEDFVLDLGSGRIRYAVLSFGGVLGIGNKLFAIPPDALSLEPDGHRWVLDVDKETLKEAPGFDKDDWPDTSEEDWQVEVYEFYGYTPYWR